MFVFQAARNLLLPAAVALVTTEFQQPATGSIQGGIALAKACAGKRTHVTFNTACVHHHYAPLLSLSLSHHPSEFVCVVCKLAPFPNED